LPSIPLGARRCCRALEVPCSGAVFIRRKDNLSPKARNWLLIPFVGAVLLAGCGGSGSTRASTDPKPAAKTTTKKDYITPPAGPKEIAACKRGVKGAQSLSAATREELNGVCDKEVEGTPKEGLKVVQIVCREVANSLPHATESAKAGAYARCEAEVAG
jgi:hypothetical protein